MVLDCRDEPTLVTKLSITFGALGKLLEFHRAVMPILKALTFIADL